MHVGLAKRLRKYCLQGIVLKKGSGSSPSKKQRYERRMQLMHPENLPENLPYESLSCRNRNQDISKGWSDADTNELLQNHRNLVWATALP